jgi:parvulin-like peptidyl-prolyl isomerase
MKKLTAKLRKKAPVEEKATRITNQTVAEHREQILAGGRKFKYPVQYAKHKLVLNSVLISIAAVVALVVLGWYLLYVAQANSKFMYRLTQLVPVPVANVDGQSVRYSDYLKKYRSDIFSLVQQEQINLKSSDGKRQAEYYKRKELDNAEKDAYVTKLAKQKNIKVSRDEINAFIARTVNRKSISLEAYEKTVLENFYDWSLDDYRGVVKARLLAKKVGFAIDDKARARAKDLAAKAAAPGADFAKLAAENSDDMATKQNGGDAGSLPLDNQDVHGLIPVAQKLTPGQVSKPIEGADGYYIIKLIEKNDSSVHYALIKIGLTELDKRFEAVKKAGKIKEYIEVAQIE